MAPTGPKPDRLTAVTNAVAALVGEPGAPRASDIVARVIRSSHPEQVRGVPADSYERFARQYRAFFDDPANCEWRRAFRPTLAFDGPVPIHAFKFLLEVARLVFPAFTRYPSFLERDSTWAAVLNHLRDPGGSDLWHAVLHEPTPLPAPGRGRGTTRGGRGGRLFGGRSSGGRDGTTGRRGRGAATGRSGKRPRDEYITFIDGARTIIPHAGEVVEPPLRGTLNGKTMDWELLICSKCKHPGHRKVHCPQ